MRRISGATWGWRLSLALCACALVAWVVCAAGLRDAGAAAVCRWLAAAAALAAGAFGVADYGWRRFRLDLPESLRIAGAQIRANKMRSALTALGVIIGILAVTMMGTAILGIDAGVDESFAGFGDDLLYVAKRPWATNEEWWVYRNRRQIETDHAANINEWIAAHPGGPLRLAVPSSNWNTSVIHGELRVSNIYVLGTTSDYARIVRSDMKEGRFFSEIESHAGRNVAVLGFDVAEALFPGRSALGQWVQVRGQRFSVVGVAARQGSFMGLFSWDSQVIVPLAPFTRIFPPRTAWVDLRVQVDPARLDEARDELRGIMRRLRRLGPEQPDDFAINSQQVFRDQLDPIKAKIFIGGMAVVALALLVGAIGIMNITYVSVKERTKEIGTRKALGARRNTILLQFLIEAVSIATLGGAIGLALAWALAAAAGAAFPQFPLVFSPVVALVGLSVSALVGVFSGFAPAWSASKLDPVAALRYE